MPSTLLKVTAGGDMTVEAASTSLMLPLLPNALNGAIHASSVFMTSAAAKKVTLRTSHNAMTLVSPTVD